MRAGALLCRFRLCYAIEDHSEGEALGVSMSAHAFTVCSTHH